MGTIAMSGDEMFAPIYLPEGGVAPSWAGKSVYALTKAEIEQVNVFATDEAWQMGYDDVCDGRVRENPFHRGFLHGVPYALFALWYRRGTLAGNNNSLSRDGGLLFAA